MQEGTILPGHEARWPSEVQPRPAPGWTIQTFVKRDLAEALYDLTPRSRYQSPSP
jgi:hypothetical protein